MEIESLHGTFREKKQFISESTLPLCSQKHCVFLRIVFGDENVSTAPNNVLSETFTNYFDLFYNN